MALVGPFSINYLFHRYFLKYYVAGTILDMVELNMERENISSVELK